MVSIEQLCPVSDGSVVMFVTGGRPQVSLQVAVTALCTSTSSPLQPLLAAQHQLGQLLHQVDEEEAGTEHQLRQELQLQSLRRALQVVADLWQEVDEGGGQEDPTTEAEEK